MQAVTKVSSKSKKIGKARKSRVRSQQPSTPVDNEVFVCEKCGEEFPSGWALGGHASRVYPGKSDAYRREIQRREERTFERDLLQFAKETFQSLWHAELLAKQPENSEPGSTI